jgi:ADP-ribose pyrophosphatase
MDLQRKVISNEIVFKDTIVTVEKTKIQLQDNTVIERPIMRRPDAVVIIPITDDGCVLMVKQFRDAIEEVVLEMPAGMIDDGEDPKETAIRELEEETGMKTNSIEFITSFFPCPSYCDEQLHIFVAPNLKPGKVKLDEYECLELEKVRISDLLDMVYNKKTIIDAKTIICAHIAQKYISRHN